MKFALAFLAMTVAAQAQSPANGTSAGRETGATPKSERATLLRELNSSLEQLASKVSPAVVQILVSGFGPEESHDHTDTARIVRQHAIGSGVIVDPDGYVITNAHVVEGAQRVRVIVSLPASSSSVETQPLRSQQIFEAKVLGRHKNSDLALLKIEATHLPAVTLRDDVRVRQGDLVFAIGSPEGLRNSVTMGIVSSVARQTDTNDPMFYIQTDAALNPGNSGGPLVDIDGNLVGINTFMLSSGGGSEGLGFAIPAAIVKFDYQNLREYGHVQRIVFGAKGQNITPTLAAGLGLSRSWGVILSNVVSDGFAQIAGLHVGDIVVAIDGRQVDDLPSLMEALYLHPRDQVLKIDALRGEKSLSVVVPIAIRQDKVDDLTDVPDLQRTFVSELSIVVGDLNDLLKPLLPADRADSGIVVIAQAAGPNAVDTGLRSGDIIKAINRTELRSVSQLQAAVHQLKSGDPVVLQIQRDGNLQYLAFEMD